MKEMAETSPQIPTGEAIQPPTGVSGAIRGTDGNDLVTVDRPKNAQISTGKGDDVINIRGGQGVSVDPGSGKNTVNITGSGGVSSTSDGKVYNEEFAQPSSSVSVDARGGKTAVNIDSGVRDSAVFGNSDTQINYSSPNRGEALGIKPDQNGYTLSLNGNKVVTAVGDGESNKGEPSLTLNGKAVNMQAIRECMANTVSGGRDCNSTTVMYGTPAAVQSTGKGVGSP